MRYIKTYENTSNRIYTFLFESNFSPLYKSMKKIKVAFNNKTDLYNYIINLTNDIIDELNSSGDFKEIIEKVDTPHKAYNFFKDLHSDEDFNFDFKFETGDFDLEIDVDKPEEHEMKKNARKYNL